MRRITASCKCVFGVMDGKVKEFDMCDGHSQHEPIQENRFYRCPVCEEVMDVSIIPQHIGQVHDGVFFGDYVENDDGRYECPYCGQDYANFNTVVVDHARKWGLTREEMLKKILSVID